MTLTRLEMRLAARTFAFVLPGGAHPAIPRGPSQPDVVAFLDAFFAPAPFLPALALRLLLVITGLWPALLLPWWSRSRLYPLREATVLLKALSLFALATDPLAHRQLHLAPPTPQSSSSAPTPDLTANSTSPRQPPTHEK